MITQIPSFIQRQQQQQAQARSGVGAGSNQQKKAQAYLQNQQKQNKWFNTFINLFTRNYILYNNKFAIFRLLLKAQTNYHNELIIKNIDVITY